MVRRAEWRKELGCFKRCCSSLVSEGFAVRYCSGKCRVVIVPGGFSLKLVGWRSGWVERDRVSDAQFYFVVMHLLSRGSQLAGSRLLNSIRI